MKKAFFASLVILFILITAFVLTACDSNKVDYKMKDGIWRAEFSVHNEKIPFIFEVTGSSTDSMTIYFINGEERVTVENIQYVEDTVNIYIEAYDVLLTAKSTPEKIEGNLKRLYTEDESDLPFVAQWNLPYRFEVPESFTRIPVEGRWDIQFTDEEGILSKNVGIFSQTGEDGRVTGSILTNIGDLRYLDGALTENGFQLSAFGGLSPYLIKAQFEGNNRFEGELYTVNGIFKLKGERNDNAALTDPYSLTSLKEGVKRLNFTFPNIEGNMVSLSDQRYQNKVVIVSIQGSWCPNCLDQMEYLSPWYKENHNRGIEIIGLSFERRNDPEYVKRVLSRLIERYDITYQLLFAGKVGLESTSEVLPELERIKAFPTTIFLDKKGIVRKIHTGFNGPATGLFYEEFKKEFNRTVDELVNE